MIEEQKIQAKALKRAKNSVIFGVIALVISLLPIASAWFLIIGWLGWIFEILALIFGILALTEGEKKNSIIGIICAVLAFLAPFLLSRFYVESALESTGNLLNTLDSLQ